MSKLGIDFISYDRDEMIAFVHFKSDKKLRQFIKTVVIESDMKPILDFPAKMRAAKSRTAVKHKSACVAGEGEEVGR